MHFYLLLTSCAGVCFYFQIWFEQSINVLKGAQGQKVIWYYCTTCWYKYHYSANISATNQTQHFQHIFVIQRFNCCCNPILYKQFMIQIRKLMTITGENMNLISQWKVNFIYFHLTISTGLHLFYCHVLDLHTIFTLYLGQVLWRFTNIDAPTKQRLISF